MNNNKKEFVIPAENTVLQNENTMSIPFECGGEFVLPDYMPKVQKVLRVEARALPQSKYIGQSRIQMSGDVLHTLIYLGEEGEVGATVLPSKYEFSIPIDEGAETPSVFANVSVDGITHRLVGPRKIVMRTRLLAAANTFLDRDITMHAENAEKLHKLYGEMDTVKSTVKRSDEIMLSERMDIHEGDKLLWCGSSAAVSDVRVSDGGVNIHGDVFVKLLTDGTEGAKMNCKKISFDEFVDMDISKSASATAIAKVISTEAATENEKEAIVDMVICVDVLADTPSKSSVVKDAFSSSLNGKTEYTEVKSKKHCTSRSGIFGVSGAFSKSVLGNDDMISVIDTSGDAAVHEVTFSDGKMTVSGRCNMKFVFSLSDGSMTMGEHTLPFNIILPCDATEDSVANTYVSLANAVSRIEGENIVCDMDIALGTRVFENKDTRIVSSVDFPNASKYEKNRYPVCLIYPNRESLWGVAKKYHVAPETLIKVNSLSVSERDMDNPSAINSNILMLEF